MLKGRCIKTDGLTTINGGQTYYLEPFGQVAYEVYTLKMERVGVFQRDRFALIETDEKEQLALF